MTTNRYDLYCRETAGLEDGWQSGMIETIHSDDGTIHFHLIGHVYAPHQRGPKKGKPNFSNPVRETRREFLIPEATLNAWLTEREARTGICKECLGDTQVFVRWTSVLGAEFKPCGRCGGTGKRVAA